MEQNLLQATLLGPHTLKAAQELLQSSTDAAEINFTLHGVTPAPALTPVQLHIRSFIDHERTYHGGGNSGEGAAEVPGWSSGVYLDAAGVSSTVAVGMSSAASARKQTSSSSRMRS